MMILIEINDLLFTTENDTSINKNVNRQQQAEKEKTNEKRKNKIKRHVQEYPI